MYKLSVYLLFIIFMCYNIESSFKSIELCIIIFKSEYKLIESGLIILKHNLKPVESDWPSIKSNLKISQCNKACNSC